MGGAEQVVTNEVDLESLCQLALDEACSNGATQADVGVSRESGLSATVRLGEVETIEHNRDKGLSVTVYMGQRKGSSSTSDFSEEAIAMSVQAACDIAANPGKLALKIVLPASEPDPLRNRRRLSDSRLMQSPRSVERPR